MNPFRTVYMDPNWNERGGGNRGAQEHYPLLSTHDIHATISLAPEWRQVADDAHLYMWATNTFLRDALRLMGDLGFTYVTNLAWVKTKDGVEVPVDEIRVQIGLGQYFRGSHELLLFGVRGQGYEVRTEARDIPSVGFAPRGRHSAKPHSFYDLIEARSEGPYLEMFARNTRPGWASWGNEVASSMEARA